MANETLDKNLKWRIPIDDVLQNYIKVTGASKITAAIASKTFADIETIGVDPNDASKLIVVFKEETGP